MAGKRNMQPLAAGDILLQDGTFKLKLTALELIALVATGVTGSGVLLANVGQRFSLMHPTFDAEGKPLGELPVNYSVSIRISRDPIPGNDAEREAVDKAAAETKANAKARTDAETQTRQAGIKAATELTTQMLKEGIALGTRAVPQADLIGSLKQTAELIPLLQQLKQAV